jgi:hypothetical protein
MFVKYTAAKNNEKCAAAPPQQAACHDPVARGVLWLRDNLKVSLRRNKPLAATQSARGVLWLRHNLKVSLRRNKPLAVTQSRAACCGFGIT